MSWIQTLLSWFKSNPYYTGVEKDQRHQSEQNKDWAHEERQITAPIDPFSNQQILQSPYFYENQHGTSACVFHGVGLALAIERKVDKNEYERLSWIFGYRLRSNYPAEGAAMQDGFDVYRHNGACLFSTLPTPQFEREANAIILTAPEYNEAALYKGLNYFTIKNNYSDITTLAQIAQQGHGVPIVIFSTIEEWGRDYPAIVDTQLTYQQAEVRHCVCILPNSGFIKDGQKYVTVQDSAWFAAKPIRHVSELFVKTRVVSAGYWDTVATLGTGVRPKYVFNTTLKYGDSGADVKAMQQLFVSEGLLPSEMITGAFYGRTLAALHGFQAKYATEILIPNNLTKPTDLFGPATRMKANQLCS